MSPTRPVLVGAFVLGALALAVIAILTFGGLDLFTHSIRVVAVFRDSIAGLEVGAPVTFRGLRIGRVERMRLHVDGVRHDSWIPVYLTVYPDRITWVNGLEGGTPADLRAAVAAGLRAQLVSQSLVSGQLSVDLDYHPSTPAVLSGHPDEQFEIPTIPSDLENLKDQLRNLDLPAISQKTQQVLASIQLLLQHVDARVGPLTTSLQGTLAATTVAVRNLQSEAVHTAADIDRLANESRGQITTNGQDLDQLLKNAEQTVNKADALVATLNDMSSPNADLQAAMRDLAASASSLRSLTHDLERNPLGTLLRRQK